MNSLKYFLLLIFFVATCGLLSAQNTQKLDVSLFWKKSGAYHHYIEDEKGDLFSKLGHHGPALENLWLAYRVYFNASGSVDILSKFQPRLELQKSHWYPKKNNCSEDYGTDNYDVGKSVGLGGIQLYDPIKGLQALGQVSKRSAEVILTDTMAQIKMTSYGIPYNNLIVDIEFTLTCFADERHAFIEVRELKGQSVQFASGLSMNKELALTKAENYMFTWGDYNSHAKYAHFEIGAALIYNPNDFIGNLSEEHQELLLSKPCSSLSYYISACNDAENSKLNLDTSFEKYLKNLALKLYPK